MTSGRRRRIASGLLGVGLTTVYLLLDPYALLSDSLAAFVFFVPFSLGLYAVDGPPWRSRLGSGVAMAVGLAVAEFV